MFPKVQNTMNQVFIMKGLEKTDNVDLTSIVMTDNINKCKSQFWSIAIDNS